MANNLLFKISTFLGSSTLHRSTANTNVGYATTNQGTQKRTLEQDEFLVVSNVSVLHVMCDGPLKFRGSSTGQPQVQFTIQRALVLDQLFDQVAITNEGEDPVTLTMIWATALDQDVPPGPPPTDFVTSVNSILPDSTGNVALDTGVMTINEIDPDAEGNFNTDEGHY